MKTKSESRRKTTHRNEYRNGSMDENGLRGSRNDYEGRAWLAVCMRCSRDSRCVLSLLSQLQGRYEDRE